MLILLLCVQGCASGGKSIMKDVQPSDLSPIRAGTSTKADVVAAVGLPNSTETVESDDGGTFELWIYRKSPSRPSFIARVFQPAFMGGSITRQKDVAAVVVFDLQGVVVGLDVPAPEAGDAP